MAGGDIVIVRQTARSVIEPLSHGRGAEKKKHGLADAGQQLAMKGTPFEDAPSLPQCLGCKGQGACAEAFLFECPHA